MGSGGNFTIINVLCIPESFNKNISQKHFDYKINFVNSQQKNNNSKSEFVFKNQFENLFYRFLVYKNKSDSDY